MKTIKVIDLYNKIANGKDEDYKKIKFIFNDYTYTWNEYKCDYDCENTAHLKTGILGYLSIDKDQLNREIEIIEDTPKEDKKIEKLNCKYTSDVSKLKVANKVDEIIELLNNSVLLSEKEVGNFLDKVNGENNENNE